MVAVAVRPDFKKILCLIFFFVYVVISDLSQPKSTCSHLTKSNDF